jgi:hypothetical protein
MRYYEHPAWSMPAWTMYALLCAVEIIGLATLLWIAFGPFWAAVVFTTWFIARSVIVRNYRTCTDTIEAQARLAQGD